MSSKLQLLLLLWLGTLGCTFGGKITKKHNVMVGQNHCTWGPAYWCSHVAKAKECGAIEHCASVWGKLKFSEKAESCSVCESFVIGADKLNENQIEMKKIGHYMDSMCSYFKGADVIKKCQLDVIEYLPEIFQLLKFGMNANSICHTLNFCQAGRYILNVEHSDTTKPANNSVTTASPDKKECHDCEVFFEDVRKRLTSHDVIENIEQQFINELCPYLGPFSKICEKYVDAYVPILMQQLSMYIAPEFFCSLLTFCPTSKEAAISHLMESVLKNNNLKDECQNCKVFLNNVKKQLMSNTTTAELQQILKQEVCSHLGEYKQMCNMVVDSYAGIIISDLVAKIDSAEICHEIGVCSAQIIIDAIAEHFSRVKFATANPFSEATECEMCKVLIRELHDVVEDKHVQAQITDFISNEVCSRLGDMKSSCLQLVMEYKPLIIKSIESLLNPVAGCTAVGMCSKKDAVAAKTSSMPMARIMPAVLAPFNRVGLVLPQKPKNSEECEVCKLFISRLESFLKDQSTEKEIADMLDKVCQLLPGSYSKSCQNFINTYTAGIISLLIQELKPEVICESLNVCSSSGNTNLGLSDQTGCVYCTKIIHEASQNLKVNSDMTETEFKAYLIKACQNGGQFTAICHSAAEKYSATVYNALKKGESPSSVCGVLDLCPAKMIKAQTEHFFVVFCEILKATGINTECRDLASISKEMHAAKLPSKELGVKVKSGALCYACTLLVGEMEEKLTSKSTEAEIRKMVDKMCDEISPEIEHECDALMNYEDELIKLLVNRYPAKKVCQMLQVCSTSQLKLA
ncbi:prosaposin-like isoform X2 [Argonauta hians]